VEDYSREIHARRGYEFVHTPQLARDHLWKTSGHFDYYRENMYTLKIDADEYVIKPMNCPAHIAIFKSRRHSYRELPLRYFELGTVCRYERTGTLHGLLRVRGFTQDDAHIFCTPDQIEAEIAGVLSLTSEILGAFGFTDYEVELSVRDPSTPGKYAGTDAEWERAEAALERVLRDRGLPVERREGEAVFYGPKIDVKLVDALGRRWQASTVQFDFNLPRRFGVTYAAADGTEPTAVMVHRAIFGSVERFIGTLIEHYGGAFPLWLAPIQAVLIPITDRTLPYCREWAARLVEAGLRAEVDDRNEKLGYKIREAQLGKIPLMLVAGDQEAREGKLSVRSREGGDLGLAVPDRLIPRLSSLVRDRRLDLDLAGILEPAAARPKLRA
jgi:threonyl-tRNA synthetase